MKDLAATAKRKKSHKQKLVDYKGGKCYVCGYNKCNRALEFHHLDPALKDPILFRRISNSKRNIKADLVELDKCVLLCANCHREVHDNLVDLYELNNRS